MLLESFGDEPEFLWEKDPLCGVFRNKNNKKWYAIVMNVKRSKLDIGDMKVDVLNVKLEGQRVQELLNEKGFYPAYHMNKKSWISIILDDTIDDSKVMECISESYRFTENASEWIVPANPKYYDVISYFEKSDIISWKQSSNVKVGDSVYIYVAKPYSTILYKCEVIKIDVPYRYEDENLKMSKVMHLKLKCKYDDGKYTFDILKQYGINAIRGPRTMPAKLSMLMQKN